MIKIITESDVLSNEEVKLIDENGTQIGVISLSNAYQIAIGKKLDLAIVSETTTPKIAKIVNYGKILYEQKKAKKNQKSAVKIKEIKFGLNVGEHDYQIKLNKIIELLNEGNKVRVYLVLKGRETDHLDYAIKFMERVVSDLNGFGKTEDKIQLESKNIILDFTKA